MAKIGLKNSVKFTIVGERQPQKRTLSKLLKASKYAARTEATMVFVSIRVRREALSRAPSPTDFQAFVLARVRGNCRKSAREASRWKTQEIYNFFLEPVKLICRSFRLVFSFVEGGEQLQNFSAFYFVIRAQREWDSHARTPTHGQRKWQVVRKLEREPWEYRVREIRSQPSWWSLVRSFSYQNQF